MNPDFSYTLGPATIAIFGNQPRILDNLAISHEQALALGASRDKIAQLIVASDGSKPGHKGVYSAKYDGFTHWDGAVIRERGAAIIIQTADCPALALFDPTSGGLALAHAGRPALDSSVKGCSACSSNVVDNALSTLSRHNNSETKALVVGDICGSCFRHDVPDAEPHIAYFRRLPAPVFADAEKGALDLYQVIKHYLTHHGVALENIRREGPCTLETPTLASYRRDKTMLRNTVIAVLS
ncbi:MAG: hypothetical protein RL538_337 [Candidatus Parcubacteria bacterium]|jgi:copper oxidase (laccase) domain-containing protein